MDGWYMDSDFCCECGCLLDYWESDLCFDCQEDQAYNEEQDRYAAFERDEEDVTQEIMNTFSSFRRFCGFHLTDA